LLFGGFVDFRCFILSEKKMHPAHSVRILLTPFASCSLRSHPAHSVRILLTPFAGPVGRKGKKEWRFRRLNFWMEHEMIFYFFQGGGKDESRNYKL
jgi:hypothetical protein